MTNKAQEGSVEGTAEPAGTVSSLATLMEVSAGDDRPIESVVVPEWNNATFLLRGLTGTARDSWEEDQIEGKGRNREMNMRNARGSLVTRSLVKPDGSALVTRAEWASTQQYLGSRGSLPLQRLFRVATRLSGLSEDELEDLTKELKGDPSAEPG